MNIAKPPRRYRMAARAEAAAATTARILDAASALFWAQPSPEIRLDEVAARAGVTVQTVIRHFGGKDKLFEAMARREASLVREARFRVPPGDIAAAATNLVEHYERYGDRVMRLLSEEDRIPALKAVADGGRRMHREWCQQVFEPYLDQSIGPAVEPRLAMFVAVCDVYTWKLLRRDSQLSVAQTATALTETLTALVKEAR